MDGMGWDWDGIGWYPGVRRYRAPYGANNGMSDRLRTHLIPRYIAETGEGAGVGKIQRL